MGLLAKQKGWDGDRGRDGMVRERERERGDVVLLADRGRGGIYGPCTFPSYN